MDISAKKLELIEWLTRVQDKSLLRDVEVLKKRAIAESYESNLKPMTAQQYKSLLDQAEDDYKNRRITSQEDIEKESKNW